jgi:hypothetical protein
MSDRKEVLIARAFAPASGHPEQPQVTEAGGRLDVAVVFTSAGATLAALRKAGVLASHLGGRITLLVTQVVPYPLALENPPVPVDFTENRLSAIATESPVETVVRVYLCRDRFTTLAAALKPHSLVVLGGNRRWWPTPEQVLARRLRRAGHEVIFAEAE